MAVSPTEFRGGGAMPFKSEEHKRDLFLKKPHIARSIIEEDMSRRKQKDFNLKRMKKREKEKDFLTMR